MRQDAEGRLLAYGSPQGTLGQMLYDASGKTTGILDRHGRQVFWLSYDPQGRLSAVRDLAERTVTYTYTDGLLASVRDVLGHTTRYGYAKGRLTEKTDPLGHVVLIGYNAQGILSEVVDSRGEGFSFRFPRETDGRRSYARVETLGGRIKEISFDAEGNTRTVIEDGKIVKRIDKHTTGFTVTDEFGRVTRKELDASRNVTHVVYPDGSSVSFTFDPRWNRLTSRTDERGITTALTYDAAANLIRSKRSQGSSKCS